MLSCPLWCFARRTRHNHGANLLTCFMARFAQVWFIAFATVKGEKPSVRRAHDLLRVSQRTNTWACKCHDWCEARPWAKIQLCPLIDLVMGTSKERLDPWPAKSAPVPCKHAAWLYNLPWQMPFTSAQKRTLPHTVGNCLYFGAYLSN